MLFFHWKKVQSLGLNILKTLTGIDLKLFVDVLNSTVMVVK